MNRGLKLAFLVSIVLNVLFVGVLLGQLPNRFGRESFRQQRIEKAATQLPEPARSRFLEKMEQLRGEVQPIRDQIQEARNETIRVFTAQPFDEAAYDRLVGKISELRLQLSKRLSASMKEVARGLTPEQRQTLAEGFKHPPPPSR